MREPIHNLLDPVEAISAHAMVNNALSSTGRFVTQEEPLDEIGQTVLENFLNCLKAALRVVNLLLIGGGELPKVDDFRSYLLLEDVIDDISLDGEASDVMVAKNHLEALVETTELMLRGQRPSEGQYLLFRDALRTVGETARARLPRSRGRF